MSFCFLFSFVNISAIDRLERLVSKMSCVKWGVKPNLTQLSFFTRRSKAMYLCVCVFVFCHYLQELCLHTKLLAPVNTLIADFLAKAPDPPAFLLTRNAVHILKVSVVSALPSFSLHRMVEYHFCLFV